ncbi:hypothetical protein BGW39_001864, partial [Mortierella sp. 14UC]
MQRQGDKLDMPGGFKDTPVTFSKDSHYGTSSTADPTPIATAMRSSNTINPHESAYEIAGPSMGGSPAIHNRALDTVKKGQILPDPVAPVYNSDTPAHTLADTVKDSATTAATGAVAAGASIIAAAKNLINRRNDNEFGDPHVNAAPHPIANSANSANSPSSLSSPKTSSIGSSSPSLSQSKPLGPHDRPPVRVAIHAQKPSDKATYGNLDSPGAHNHPGPLSERALASTPPPSSLPLPRTIADPFGPVMVTNWNDGKRQADVSTPTSDDFDSPHVGPMRDRSEKSSTDPGSAPSTQTTKRLSNPSPLREGVPAMTMGSATTTDVKHPTPNKAEYFPQAHHSSTMTAPHSHNKEPLGERIKDVFHHHNSPTPTTPAAQHYKEPLGERVMDTFHHESHPTVEVPIKVNTPTIATSSAAPEIFTDKTEYVPVENLGDIDISKVAQAASPQPVTIASTTTTKPLAPKGSIVDRVEDVFHHDPSAPATVHHETNYVPTVVEKHHEPLIAATSTTAPSHPTRNIVNPTTSTSTVEKEPLVDRVKDVFGRNSHETAAEKTHATSTKTAAPVTVPAAAGTAAGVAAFLNDKDVDNTTTPPKVHDHRAYLAPGAKSSIATTAEHAAPAVAVAPEVESHVFRPVDTSPPKKHTPAPAPVFDTKYMNTPAPAPTAATTTSTTAIPAIPVVHTITTSTKPVSEIHFTDPSTLRPLTGTRTWEIPPPVDHRSIATRVMDAIDLHSSSEYGPADPKDLPLTDSKTLRLMKDVAPDAAADSPLANKTTAATTNTHTPVAPVMPDVQTMSTPDVTAKPVSEIQFTDPTALRPLTGTRTWEIPPPVDRRSIATRVMDAIDLHSSS